MAVRKPKVIVPPFTPTPHAHLRAIYAVVATYDTPHPLCIHVRVRGRSKEVPRRSNGTRYLGTWKRVSIHSGGTAA